MSFDIAILQMINAHGAGEATLRRAILRAAELQVTLEDVVSLSPDDLAHDLHIKPSVAEGIRDARDLAARSADELEKQGIRILPLGAPHYPTRLPRTLGKDAPAVLFAKGNISVFDRSAVGFCGSRKASEKGLGIAADAARILTEHGINVVSGYAHGVDMVTHRAALEAGGTTTFVLVEGILRFKAKKEIRELIEEGNYLVVSQFPPNLPWNSRNAMKRNATILGLSDAMILVESGTSGGTFAAGEETLKRKWPLFVVDYATRNPSAAGNATFLKHGAIPLRSNRDGLPNLEKVLSAIQNESQRSAATRQRKLFDTG